MILLEESRLAEIQEILDGHSKECDCHKSLKLRLVDRYCPDCKSQLYMSALLTENEGKITEFHHCLSCKHVWIRDVE